MVPAAIVLAALGLMLAFVPRRTAGAALLLAIGAALAFSQIALAPRLTDAAILACWIAVGGSAFRIYRPGQAAAWLTLAQSAASGAVAGVAVAAAGTPAMLWQPVLAAAIVVPASIAVERGYPVAPRVVASWLLAVAVLAALLPYIVTHPGYIPDHRG